jgi:hypothetical protein
MRGGETVGKKAVEKIIMRRDGAIYATEGWNSS